MCILGVKIVAFTLLPMCLFHGCLINYNVDAEPTDAKTWSRTRSLWGTWHVTWPQSIFSHPTTTHQKCRVAPEASLITLLRRHIRIHTLQWDCPVNCHKTNFYQNHLWRTVRHVRYIFYIHIHKYSQATTFQYHSPSVCRLFSVWAKPMRDNITL